MNYFERKFTAAARKFAEHTANRAVRSNERLSGVIDAYVARSNSTGCSYSDYWKLYSDIRRFKPRYVLELGTGISTAVIATALAENGRGKVISVEEHQQWHDLAAKALPDECRPYVELIRSNTTTDAFGPFRGVRYRDVPEWPYDYVFVDGPAFTVDGEFTFDFDFLHVLKNTPAPINGLIDKRVGTVYVLQQLLGTRKVRFDPIRNLGIVRGVSLEDLPRMNREPPSSGYDIRTSVVRPRHS